MKNLKLIPIKRTDPHLLMNMEIHYSQPKGFVGRNICYAIISDFKFYGCIVGGSATLHLPGRDEFFGKFDLNQIINNNFYHVEKYEGEYPFRNFTIYVLGQFREKIQNDWQKKYGDIVLGFESLVELPRTGEIYIRDGWTEVGTTIGYTCKRTSGKGTDSWGGKRIWYKEHLKPKRVFCKKI
jgi:hypothetical protein